MSDSFVSTASLESVFCNVWFCFSFRFDNNSKGYLDFAVAKDSIVIIIIIIIVVADFIHMVYRVNNLMRLGGLLGE